MGITLFSSRSCVRLLYMGVPILLLLIYSCGAETKSESSMSKDTIDDFIPVRMDSIESIEQDEGTDSLTGSEVLEGSGLGAGAGHGEGAGMGSTEGVEGIGHRRVERADSIQKTKTESQGSLAFYCPKYMIENTACNVSLLISKDSLEKVKKLLSEKMLKSVTNSTEKSIKKDIEAHSISIYEKMKVELKFDVNEFDLLASPQNETVVFTQNTNQREWDWVVKPKRPGNLQLILIVSAYSEAEGVWIAVESPPRIFNIGVRVDPRGYFVKLWGFFGANPEWLLTQLLFPVVTFFVGKKRGKKRR